MASLRALEERTPGDSPLSDARGLIAQAQDPARHPDDRSALVEYLLASGLLNRFITVSNTRPEDEQVVVKGNEKVIRARLSDAMFFWEEDQKVRLESNLEALKQVIYQAKLGTSYEKVERFKLLARGLAERFEPAAAALTERAAELAKCDLETKMVYEFPELQGIMGREYSRLEGENPRVSTAIFEHYLPTEAGGTLPSDNVGAFVSIADKIDTICGCFRAGLIPTGAADPYALRRQGIGVIQIMRQRNFSFPLAALVDQSLRRFDAAGAALPDTAGKILAFIEGRMASILVEEGFAKDTVAAVLGVPMESVPNVWRRAQALQQLKDKPDFEPIAVSFKRVVNIIRRAEGFTPGPVEERLLTHPSESGLLSAYRSVHGQVQDDLRRGLFDEALVRVASLRQPVDAFFDDVMVMAEDAEVRRNRLSLLALVAALFDTFADFSKLSA